MTTSPLDRPYVYILGTAQDGGYPQAGCRRPCCEAARREPSRRRLVCSIVVIDPGTDRRFLIDITPDFPEQLDLLRQEAGDGGTQPLTGIFLTHAHIGHYTGLMYLGREVMGARALPLHAMPEMAGFLRRHGPWSQLIRVGNVSLLPLADGAPVELAPGLSITPFLVPHRDEFSETVGFRIQGPERAVVFIPDIDKWDAWDRPIEEVIRQADVALLDGTFYRNGEIPGRDMAEIPHPFIEESVARLRALPLRERAKVRFIHLNHTNPLLLAEGPERAALSREGFGVAEQGERFVL